MSAAASGCRVISLSTILRLPIIRAADEPVSVSAAWPGQACVRRYDISHTGLNLNIFNEDRAADVVPYKHKYGIHSAGAVQIHPHVQEMICCSCRITMLI
jgi:hypothetical protein